MSKIYEAIYENGKVEWLGARPEEGRHHIVVTVVDRPSRRHSRKDIQRMLESTRGAWGRGKPISEIDVEIERMRSEWERPLPRKET